MVRVHLWKDAFLNPLETCFNLEVAHCRAFVGRLGRQNGLPRAQNGLQTFVWASQWMEDHSLDIRFLDPCVSVPE